MKEKMGKCLRISMIYIMIVVLIVNVISCNKTKNYDLEQNIKNKILSNENDNQKKVLDNNSLKKDKQVKTTCEVLQKIIEKIEQDIKTSKREKVKVTESNIKELMGKNVEEIIKKLGSPQKVSLSFGTPQCYKYINNIEDCDCSGLTLFYDNSFDKQDDSLERINIHFDKHQKVYNVNYKTKRSDWILLE